MFYSNDLEVTQEKVQKANGIVVKPIFPFPGGRRFHFTEPGGNEFGWSFQDFGPEYSAFSNQGIDGGFYKSDLSSSTENGAALIVFYSNDLEVTQEKVKKANGIVVKPIFPFPGGRRFHFTEPSGNEFAVWSDKNA